MTPIRSGPRAAAAAVSLSSVLMLAACQRPAEAPASDEHRIVQTAPVVAAGDTAFGLSGTVRARVESPLAFLVGGRIAARRVDAGRAVAAGQVLFELDPADLEQALRAAEADTMAADTSWRTAQADLARVRELKASAFVSQQAQDRAELAQREARSRLDAATARLAQVRNTRAYAQLKSPAAGVLVEVSGQAGQVVAAGQPLATLAQHGAREIEVQLPDGLPPPAQGEALLPGSARVALRLREAAPAVDPLGRTRRARYAAPDLGAERPLGSVVAVRFAVSGGTKPSPLWQVPVGALDERGRGPRVWRVREGRPEPVPVDVVSVDDRSATVSAPLQAGERVVALGTHLLKDGMTVRERTR